MLNSYSGKAFDDLYIREVINNCDMHDPSVHRTTWKYNVNNTLPACIRMSLSLYLCDGRMIVTMTHYTCSLLCERHTAQAAGACE